MSLEVAILSRTFAKASREPIDFLEHHGFQLRTTPSSSPGDEESVAACIDQADAAIVSGQDVVNEKVFAACPRLRVVADHAIGCDQIDLEAARRRGIHVFTCPENHESVADLTWGLILSVARKIPAAHVALRDHSWNPPAFGGTEISGKTLGLIGFGRIGKCVALRSRGFSCPVLVHDPFISADDIREFARQHNLPDLVAVDRNELLRRADLISLHIPLVPDAPRVIGKAEFRLMKPTAILINTSRGGLIDEDALYNALLEGRLAGAGLDVFAKEPPGHSPLLSFPGVVATPHIGAQTSEANIRMGMRAAQGIVQFFQQAT